MSLVRAVLLGHRQSGVVAEQVCQYATSAGGGAHWKNYGGFNRTSQIPCQLGSEGSQLAWVLEQRSPVTLARVDLLGDRHGYGVGSRHADLPQLQVEGQTKWDSTHTHALEQVFDPKLGLSVSLQKLMIANSSEPWIH